MAQDDELTPATRDAQVSTLSFVLQFNERKPTHRADTFMARVAAEHLDRSGLVVSKRPLRVDLSHLTVVPSRPKE